MPLTYPADAGQSSAIAPHPDGGPLPLPPGLVPKLRYAENWHQQMLHDGLKTPAMHLWEYADAIARKRDGQGAMIRRFERSLREIEREAGIPVSVAARALRDLARAGYLSIHEGVYYCLWLVPVDYDAGPAEPARATTPGPAPAPPRPRRADSGAPILARCICIKTLNANPRTTNREDAGVVVPAAQGGGSGGTREGRAEPRARVPAVGPPAPPPPPPALDPEDARRLEEEVADEAERLEYARMIPEWRAWLTSEQVFLIIAEAYQRHAKGQVHTSRAAYARGIVERARLAGRFRPVLAKAPPRVSPSLTNQPIPVPPEEEAARKARRDAGRAEAEAEFLAGVRRWESQDEGARAAQLREQQALRPRGTRDLLRRLAIAKFLAAGPVPSPVDPGPPADTPASVLDRRMSTLRGPGEPTPPPSAGKVDVAGKVDAAEVARARQLAMLTSRNHTF